MLGYLGMNIGIVITVAAEGHVIHIERLLVDVLGQGADEHLQVTGGVLGGQHTLHAVAVAHKAFGITQVDMGHVPVIESVVVVMISFAPVAQSVQLTAHGKVV